MTVADDFLTRRPGCVAMVGLGPSANAYWLECAEWNTHVPWDEVWVVNKASAAFRHDVVFDMHDLRHKCRNSESVTERLRLKEIEKPLVTVQAYPEYPTSVTFPIKDVLTFIKHDILSSTPAYMVAYAMMIGVKEVYLYGMDFHYANLAHAEKGGQGMAYLLGMCHVLNIKFNLPHTSSLLAANECEIVTVDGKEELMRQLYGYTWDGVGGPRDPRLPGGGNVKIGAPPSAPGMMNAKDTPRYRLGEAERGDHLSPDGSNASVPSPAETTEKQ